MGIFGIPWQRRYQGRHPAFALRNEKRRPKKYRFVGGRKKAAVRRADMPFVRRITSFGRKAVGFFSLKKTQRGGEGGGEEKKAEGRCPPPSPPVVPGGGDDGEEQQGREEDRAEFRFYRSMVKAERVTGERCDYDTFSSARRAWRGEKRREEGSGDSERVGPVVQDPGKRMRRKKAKELPLPPDDDRALTAGQMYHEHVMEAAQRGKNMPRVKPAEEEWETDTSGEDPIPEGHIKIDGQLRRLPKTFKKPEPRTPRDPMAKNPLVEAHRQSLDQIEEEEDVYDHLDRHLIKIGSRAWAQFSRDIRTRREEAIMSFIGSSRAAKHRKVAGEAARAGLKRAVDIRKRATRQPATRPVDQEITTEPLLSVPYEETEISDRQSSLFPPTTEQPRADRPSQNAEKKKSKLFRPISTLSDIWRDGEAKRVQHGTVLKPLKTKSGQFLMSKIAELTRLGRKSPKTVAEMQKEVQQEDELRPLNLTISNSARGLSFAEMLAQDNHDSNMQREASEPPEMPYLPPFQEYSRTNPPIVADYSTQLRYGIPDTDDEEGETNNKGEQSFISSVSAGPQANEEQPKDTPSSSPKKRDSGIRFNKFYEVINHDKASELMEASKVRRPASVFQPDYLAGIRNLPRKSNEEEHLFDCLQDYLGDKLPNGKEKRMFGLGAHQAVVDHRIREKELKEQRLKARTAASGPEYCEPSSSRAPIQYSNGPNQNLMNPAAGPSIYTPPPRQILIPTLPLTRRPMSMSILGEIDRDDARYHWDPAQGDLYSQAPASTQRFNVIDIPDFDDSDQPITTRMYRPGRPQYADSGTQTGPGLIRLDNMSSFGLSDDNSDHLLSGSALERPPSLSDSGDFADTDSISQPRSYRGSPSVSHSSSYFTRRLDDSFDRFSLSGRRSRSSVYSGDHSQRTFGSYSQTYTGSYASSDFGSFSEASPSLYSERTADSGSTRRAGYYSDSYSGSYSHSYSETDRGENSETSSERHSEQYSDEISRELSESFGEGDDDVSHEDSEPDSANDSGLREDKSREGDASFESNMSGSTDEETEHASTSHNSPITVAPNSIEMVHPTDDNSDSTPGNDISTKPLEAVDASPVFMDDPEKPPSDPEDNNTDDTVDILTGILAQIAATHFKPEQEPAVFEADVRESVRRHFGNQQQESEADSASSRQDPTAAPPSDDEFGRRVFDFSRRGREARAAGYRYTDQIVQSQYGRSSTFSQRHVAAPSDATSSSHHRRNSTSFGTPTSPVSPRPRSTEASLRSRAESRGGSAYMHEIPRDFLLRHAEIANRRLEGDEPYHRAARLHRRPRIRPPQHRERE
ncbi:hypothetical protein H072_2372 [Dactylellina haptotyla CBS 200.50]|uniref:Uncharacterized protein n=1 Tax=Dactylellina haptotyla (strain CBS 200.50) TaxID=1284197 RepID=S8C7A7_DACHA|nr:hypothetical protein H072_2372 [Dactylellina haptotyla CBS 200.50]